MKSTESLLQKQKALRRNSEKVYTVKNGFLSLCVLMLCMACSPQKSHSNSEATTQHTAEKSEFVSADVSDKTWGTFSQMSSSLGTTVSLSDSDGKIRVLLFGYTHCPDVCPTNLFAYADAFKQLGADAGKVQLYFITVDPERDTPEALKTYLGIFHPSFVGLSAKDAVQLEKTLSAWQITSRRIKRSDGDLFDHSAGSFLVDQNGKTLRYVAHGTNGTQIANDLRLLLK